MLDCRETDRLLDRELQRDNAEVLVCQDKMVHNWLRNCVPLRQDPKALLFNQDIEANQS